MKILNQVAHTKVRFYGNIFCVTTFSKHYEKYLSNAISSHELGVFWAWVAV